jgi:tRNA nucleotidyltransferase (CCA-adding enzyme)
MLFPMLGWEHFAHEADVGIRGYGPSLEAAFEQAALAMVAAITEVEGVTARDCVRVSCEAPQSDLLLVEWLNALVYEMATRGMLFGRFDVTIADSRLSGEAWGEPVDVGRHRPAAEVKGATYTALKVSQRSDGQWLAQCVIDV